MLKFGRGLMAVENITEEVTGDALEINQSAAQVAEGTVEIAEDSAAIEAQVQDIEAGVKATEQIEDVQEIVDAAVESGDGLDETTAQMASIALEAIMNGIGGTARNIVPARESFGLSSSKMASTILVQEKISETLAGVWKRIKDAFAAAKDFILGLISRIFSTVAGLEKQLNSVREAAGKLTEEKPKSDELDNAGLAKALSVKGKADFSTAKEIGINAYQLMVAVPAMSSAAAQVAASAVHLVSTNAMTRESLADYLKSSNTAYDRGLAQVQSAFKAAGRVYTQKDFGDQKNEDADNEYFGPFASGQCLNFRGIKIKSGDVEAKALKIEFTYAKAAPAEKIATLTKSQIVEVADGGLEVVKEMKEIKKAQGAMNEINAAIAKVSDKLISIAAKVADKKGEGEDKDSVKASMEILRKQANALIGTVHSFGNYAPTIAFRSAKALADYASAALKAHGAESKKA